MVEDDDAASGFDWDIGNAEKCLKHGVSVQEIEEVLRSASLLRRVDRTHSHEEERVQAFGRTSKGRHIFVVFTRRHRSGIILVRPISARYMHRFEVDELQKEASGFRVGRGG